MADPYANGPPTDYPPDYGGAPPGSAPPGTAPPGGPMGAPVSTPPPYDGEQQQQQQQQQQQPYSETIPEDSYGQKRQREDDMNAANKRPANGASDGPQTVYRLLCDQNIMGGMIGRGGEKITAIQEKTGASIQAIQEAPPHCVERVIIVSGSREILPGEQYNASQQALFELFDQQLTLDRSSGGPVLRMLICSTQAGSVIGKQGCTIKEMKEASGCTNIKVLQPADLPPCGLASDKLFHVTGAVDTLRRVLDMASARLRDTPPKELPSHDPCQNAFPPGGPGGGPPGGPMMGPGGPGGPVGGYPMGPPMGGPGYGPPPRY